VSPVHVKWGGGTGKKAVGRLAKRIAKGEKSGENRSRNNSWDPSGRVSFGEKTIVQNKAKEDEKKERKARYATTARS